MTDSTREQADNPSVLREPVAAYVVEPRVKARGEATYADIEALPVGVTGEIIAGVLYANPRPAYRHADVGAAMVIEVGWPFRRPPGDPRGPGGWHILFEPELHFGKDVVVPDLAGWRRERLPLIPDVAALSLAPDWVCEILSPRSAGHDRIRKAHVYAREGVAWYWIVDPVVKTLEVCKLVDGRWVMWQTFEDEALIRAEPFDVIELEMARWFEGMQEPPSPEQSDRSDP